MAPNLKQKATRNALSKRVIKASLLLSLVGFIVLIWTDDLTSYIRLDKFVLHFSLFRFSVAALILGMSFVIVRQFCSGPYIGLILPINLFVYLLAGMILPGVLLTSDFSTSGRTAYYGYLFSTLAFSIGAACASFATGFKPPNEFSKFVLKSRPSHRIGSITYILMIAAFLVALPISMMSIDQSQNVFIVMADFLLTGAMPEGAREIADARQNVYLETAARRGLVAGLSSYCLVLILPISTAFVLLNGVIRKCKAEIVIGAIMASTTFALLVFSGTRLRGLLFLLFIAVALSFVRPLKLNRLIAWASMAITFLVLQTIALGRMTGADNYVGNLIMSANRVAERIFLTKGNTTRIVFDYIPDVTSFKGGSTMMTSIGGHLSSAQSFDEEMFTYVNGYYGTAGPHAFAEAYANFGVLAMLAAGTILGIIVQSTSIMVVRWRNLSAYNLTVLAMITVLIARTGYSDLLAFKSGGLHVLIVYILFIESVRRFLNAGRRPVGQRPVGIPSVGHERSLH